jgi:hypothetical protein
MEEHEQRLEAQKIPFYNRNHQVYRQFDVALRLNVLADAKLA